MLSMCLGAFLDWGENAQQFVELRLFFFACKCANSMGTTLVPVFENVSPFYHGNQQRLSQPVRMGFLPYHYYDRNIIGSINPPLRPSFFDHFFSL